jgi:hypothetical protein
MEYDFDDAGRDGGSALKAGDSAKVYALKPVVRDGGFAIALNTDANGSAATDFELVCLANVEPVPVDWLWQDRLARGHLTLLASDPGMGKSQITIDLAARLSKGAHWPLGPTMKAASTIFLCSEDSIADTIRPRAEAAGANLDNSTFSKARLSRTARRRASISVKTSTF